MIRFLLFTSIVLLTIRCTQNPNKFTDDTLVEIADFTDKRLPDSLYQFLASSNTLYRLETTRSFASIQDTNAIPKLISVLSTDTDAEVRAAAALALGQTFHVTAYPALMESLKHEKDKGVRQLILEAIGKTIPQEKLPEFQALPELIESGISWCYYNMALRNVYDSVSVNRVVKLLDPTLDESIRLGAAHFFARGPQSITPAEKMLCLAAENETSVQVKMAAVAALRKINSEKVFNLLKAILESNEDYRVQVNAVRSLSTFSGEHRNNLVLKALKSTNHHVAIAAAELIKTKSDFLLNDILDHARTTTDWRVRGNLFEAALAMTNSKEISEEIFKQYEVEDNPYAKAALLTALSKSTIAVSFISEKLLTEKIPVIQSTAAAALVTLNKHPQFMESMQAVLTDTYRKAFDLNDPAISGTIATALADSTLGYKFIYTDYTFLKEAKGRLTLPKDNEALQPIEAALAYFENRKVVPVVNEFNHPIDWNIVKTISSNQQAKIITSKGEIVLHLFVEEAPGSVANFVKLIQSGYFNNKNFHRVVPNFVIQGGCNRGDGWGSEDYSIRSEFSQRTYTAGSVGMASAGKDTEGTQWFITHSATPHLNGRYTIFAEVISGMDVVHTIVVGDTIQDIQLINN